MVLPLLKETVIEIQFFEEFHLSYIFKITFFFDNMHFVLFEFFYTQAKYYIIVQRERERDTEEYRKNMDT